MWAEISVRAVSATHFEQLAAWNINFICADSVQVIPA